MAEIHLVVGMVPRSRNILPSRWHLQPALVHRWAHHLEVTMVFHQIERGLFINLFIREMVSCCSIATILELFSLRSPTCTVARSRIRPTGPCGRLSVVVHHEIIIHDMLHHFVEQPDALSRTGPRPSTRDTRTRTRGRFLSLLVVAFQSHSGLRSVARSDQTKYRYIRFVRTIGKGSPHRLMVEPLHGINDSMA